MGILRSLRTAKHADTQIGGTQKMMAEFTVKDLMAGTTTLRIEMAVSIGKRIKI